MYLSLFVLSFCWNCSLRFHEWPFICFTWLCKWCAYSVCECVANSCFKMIVHLQLSFKYLSNLKRKRWIFLRISTMLIPRFILRKLHQLSQSAQWHSIDDYIIFSLIFGSIYGKMWDKEHIFGTIRFNPVWFWIKVSLDVKPTWFNCNVFKFTNKFGNNVQFGWNFISEN